MIFVNAFATRLSAMHYVLGLFVGCIHLYIFFRSSGQILLPQYLTNTLNSFDKAYRKYLLVPTDHLFWC